MKPQVHVAFDLGAESGRVMTGTLADGKIRLEEVHRFLNTPILKDGSIYTDIPMIFRELKEGLRKIAASGVAPCSLSTDSWGVDYAYITRDNPLLVAPYQYRDPRNEGASKRTLEKMPFKDIFGETGIQFLPFNTLYQLVDDRARHFDVMQAADSFLCIGDYFNYRFCGVAKAEESLASTTQMYQPGTRSWSKRLIQGFQFPEKIFPPIVASGTKLGPLLLEVAKETGLSGVEVVATCSHDTGAAVAAVPAEGDDWAYISSGTWSLIGVESAKPVISADTLRYNFTNEAGFGGTTRLLKNVVGLWMIQECRRFWQSEGKEFSYEELARLAGEAKPFQCLVHPAAVPFGQPGEMPRKIAEYCRQTGQPEPKTPGEMIRTVYESLALFYRKILKQLEEISGKKIRRIHVVGGGSKSDLLNQFTANATGLPVVAGPAEATALGNVLIQAIAMGHLSSLKEMREVVKYSFSPKTYEPADAKSWEKAHEQFLKLPE